VIDSFGRDER
jgi:hypothetical protein